MRRIGELQHAGSEPAEPHTPAAAAADEARLAALAEDAALKKAVARSTAHAEARRLQAIGGSAARLAHDMGNLLMVAAAQIEAVRAQLDPRHSARRALGLADTAIERLRGLSLRLSSLTNKETLQPTPLNLEEWLRPTLRLLGHLLPSHVILTIDSVGAEPCWCWADQLALERVLANLLANSRDALPDGGQITVRLETQRKRGGRQEAILTVSDNGSGMDEATLSRIFEPFFTTKRNGTGAGLGLAIVREIVRAHAGSVTVHSEVGKGTSIAVRLPTLELPPCPTATRGTANVLLVGRDRRVQPIIRRELREAGYRTRWVSDGSRAAAVLESGTRTHVCVVDADSITDEDWSALERSAGVSRCSLIMLNTETREGGDLARAKRGRVLAKPLAPGELATCIAGVLRKAAGSEPC